MRKMILFLICAAFTFAEELDVAKVSEAIGHLIGKNLTELGVDFDLDSLVKGLKEEQAGKSSPLNEEECVQAIVHLQEEKIHSLSEQELEKFDTISNGDQVHENENYSLPTSNSPKHR